MQFFGTLLLLFGAPCCALGLQRGAHTQIKRCATHMGPPTGLCSMQGDGWMRPECPADLLLCAGGGVTRNSVLADRRYGLACLLSSGFAVLHFLSFARLCLFFGAFPKQGCRCVSSCSQLLCVCMTHQCPWLCTAVFNKSFICLLLSLIYERR